MSKMFSAFLDGMPGFALLLLRFSTALLLPLTSFNAFPRSIWLDLAVALLTASLAVGFAMRLAASLSVLLMLGAAFRSDGTIGAILALQAVQSAALAVLGAGAYSIDAWLFGRRVIELTSDRASDRLD